MDGDRLFNLGKKKRLGLKAKIFPFLFMGVVAPCLCNGVPEWHSWHSPTLEDVEDLIREIPLIVGGMIWSCARPLVDLEEGITKGKTMAETKKLFRQCSEDCGRSPMAYKGRQYCFGRMNYLCQRTVDESFRKRHVNDLKGYEVSEQEYFMCRVVFHLCPSLGEELVGYLPLSILSDVVNIKGDIGNMVDRGILKVRHHRPKMVSERKFKIEISDSAIEAAFEDIRRLRPDIPRPLFWGRVPRYLCIRMVEHEFPIDETIPATTLIKTMYFVGNKFQRRNREK
jgi:hypothetical protein